MQTDAERVSYYYAKDYTYNYAGIHCFAFRMARYYVAKQRNLLLTISASNGTGGFIRRRKMLTGRYFRIARALLKCKLEK